MKITLYIICILLFHLLFISGSPPLPITETTLKEQAADTLPISGSQSALLIEQPADSLQTRSCVLTFTNQTVSSYMVVIGCDTLYVKDVTVANNGDLVLQSPGDITIYGVFEVALGGQLSVHTAPPPPPGNTMQIAINMGTFGAPFQYTDSRNTTGYTNDYVGQSTNDVFYVFTITTAMNITVKHCDSQIATYVHLLDASGTRIACNDGYSGAGG